MARARGKAAAKHMIGLSNAQADLLSLPYFGPETKAAVIVALNTAGSDPESQRFKALNDALYDALLAQCRC